MGLVRALEAATAVVLLTAVSSSHAARAQNADFKGKQITVAVPTTTGGAYDIYSRLIARHLGQFLPGNPNLVVVNMPGAGGLIMANWLANAAPKDGTAMGIVPSPAAFEGLLGNSRAQYDARRFRWLASLSDYNGVALIWHAAPFHVARDLIAKESIIGGGGTSSDVTLWPQLFNSLIGTRIKLVSGYVGTANIALAMERGEVQGIVGLDWDGWKASKPDWVRDRKSRVLMQIALTRHPDLAEVPSVMDFARSSDDREVLELIIARQRYSRAFATAPGTPDATVTALREGFDRMAASAGFVTDAQKASVNIHFVPGQEIQSWADSIYAYPKDAIERATAELRKANQ
jgi:tripartite-type tricarboxylate transporter receptor subunit TctC